MEPLCLVPHYHVTLYSGYEVHSLPTVLTQKRFTNLSLNSPKKITLDSGGRFFELIVSGKHQTLHMTAITDESSGAAWST